MYANSTSVSESLIYMMPLLAPNDRNEPYFFHRVSERESATSNQLKEKTFVLAPIFLFYSLLPEIF